MEIDTITSSDRSYTTLMNYYNNHIPYLLSCGGLVHISHGPVAKHTTDISLIIWITVKSR